MLLEILKQDCETWIASNTEVFLSEHDMQGKLAGYLASRPNHYDRVYVEYMVPMESLENVAQNHPAYPIVFGANGGEFPWDETMFIDIVVEKDGKYAAVELKYATSPLNANTLGQSSMVSVFGQKTDMDIEVIIRKTSANNDKRFDYWKDVRRIEALTRFENVEGGIALMVSNDSVYRTTPPPGQQYDYTEFAMKEGCMIGPGTLQWLKKSNDHPTFKLDGSYLCRWRDTQIQARATKCDEPFKYIMTVVSKEELGKLSVLLHLLTKMCGCGSAKCASVIKANQENK